MSDTPRIEAEGMAALTLHSVILRGLVEEGVIAKEKAVDFFKEAAALLEKAGESALSRYNKDAVSILLERAADFDEAVPKK